MRGKEKKEKRKEGLSVLVGSMDEKNELDKLTDAANARI